MRLRVPCLALVLLLGMGASLQAANTWYGYYLDARDKYIPARKWDLCLTALNEAIRLKPEPAVNEQTYGLDFVHYFPYFLEGQCYLGKGDYDSAIRLFNIEESKKQIQRREVDHRLLLRLRAEADAGRKGAESADNVRKIKDRVERFRRLAADFHKQGKLEDALSQLIQAQKLAEALNDPTMQADIADRTQKIRDELKHIEDAQTRARKIEKDLADGLKALQDGNPTVAKLEFEAVLGLEPTHAGALEGKRRAEEDILASTTREHRDALKRAGRALFEAGRYQEAMSPLAEAGADDAEARDLLARARQYVEGVQKEKDKRTRVDQLTAEAEKLLAARHYSDAYVRLGTVLELDPSNAKARERLLFAESRTGEELFNRIFPNTPPVLTFMAPSGDGPVIRVETEAQRVMLSGVASDDRGLQSIRFLEGGRVVAEEDVTAEMPRTHRIDRSFELAKGLNEIKAIATDRDGATAEQTFLVTRTLQLWQQPWFIPSAAATSVGLIGLAYAAQRTRRRRAVRSRFNPYIAGAPVLEDDMFFGRQKLLARILNVLHHNSLMITGERRIGKTTLLHHLRKALEHDEGTEYQFFPVSTDLQGVPESGFFDAVMTDVVEQVRPRPEVLATLRFRPDAETDAEAYDGRDFSHDLQRIVEDLAAPTPRKVKLVLLIDEVDVLNEYSERVNQRLRSIFMKTFSEHLVAIMSGVGIKRIWKSEGSPWYNFFDEIELTAFSREEAEALIRQPVEGVFRWTPEAVEAILEHSSLKPYIVQKFCIHAVNHMLEEGRTTITATDVEAVRSAVLFERPEEVQVAETASA